MCVAEPAWGGDFPVIKHSVPKIRVPIERNKYQNGDRPFWEVFGYAGKSPTCGGGDRAVSNAPSLPPDQTVCKPLNPNTLYRIAWKNPSFDVNRKFLHVKRVKTATSGFFLRCQTLNVALSTKTGDKSVGNWAV